MTADHSNAAAWPEETHRKPRLFRTGNIVATPGALDAYSVDRDRRFRHRDRCAAMVTGDSDDRDC